MTTVSELIEFLGQFPPETTVEVVHGEAGRNYEGDGYRRVDLELPTRPWEGPGCSMFDDHVEYYERTDGAGELLLGCAE